jgi:hypothetical protein
MPNALIESLSQAATAIGQARDTMSHPNEHLDDEADISCSSTATRTTGRDTRSPRLEKVLGFTRHVRLA